MNVTTTTNKPNLVIKFLFAGMQNFDTRPATGHGLIKVAELFMNSNRGSTQPTDPFRVNVVPADSASRECAEDHAKISHSDLLYLGTSKRFAESGRGSKVSIANLLVRYAREDVLKGIAIAQEHALTRAWEARKEAMLNPV